MANEEQVPPPSRFAGTPPPNWGRLAAGVATATFMSAMRGEMQLLTAGTFILTSL
jgi:hypothetical protein